jgi:hypothetical protein
MSLLALFCAAETSASLKMNVIWELGVVSVELLQPASPALVAVLPLHTLPLPPQVDDLVEVGRDLVGVAQGGVHHAGAVARAEGQRLKHAVWKRHGKSS